MDETRGSQDPDELNRTASAPHQEVPPYPSGAAYHTEPYRREDRMLRSNLVMHSGLLAISTVALTQILPISSPDHALRVAVFAFAVAIPLLAGSVMAETLKTAKPINIDTDVEIVMNVVGWLASTVGVTSIFIHFGVLAGVVFLAISFFALRVVIGVTKKLDDINQE